ncbi:MAG: acyl-CoA dehydrogenase family protein [Actinobacteria bacterium]|nr:acyl-CoA dehydrogenase family protein [Actinomycetota bacterium]
MGHQRAFTAGVSALRQLPFLAQRAHAQDLAATLVDFRHHEQKLPPAITQRGGELSGGSSEPSGGSDLAGCLTRADRDGDVFILNGAKTWSSSAYLSDWAMCLARTNWDVPKHRGLTMFLVEIHQPGITVREQIRRVDGSMSSAASSSTTWPSPPAPWWATWTGGPPRLLTLSMAVGGRSPYTSGRSIGHDSARADTTVVDAARSTGRTHDGHVRQLVAEAHVRQLVSAQLVQRITQGMATGAMPPPAGSLMKLFSAATSCAAPRSPSSWWARGRPGPRAPSRSAPRWRGPRCGARACRSVAAPTRSSATSSASGCSACREYAADREIPYREVRRGAGAGDERPGRRPRRRRAGPQGAAGLAGRALHARGP